MRSCEKAGNVLAPVVHGALLFLQCNVSALSVQKQDSLSYEGEP